MTWYQDTKTGHITSYFNHNCESLAISAVTIRMMAIRFELLKLNNTVLVNTSA